MTDGNLTINLETKDKEANETMANSLPKHRNILKSPETREFEKRKLVWPKEGKIIEFDGTRFFVGPLNANNTKDIKEVAECYRKGFPELFGGVYEDLLFSDKYSELSKSMRIFVMKDLNIGKIASVYALTPSEKNMSIEFSLTVTDPEYRGKGLCRRFTEIVDRMVENSGAEFGYAYCATFHTTTQKIFSDLGFEKVGVIKGFILANVGMGRYARDNVVMYTKFYNGAEKLVPERVEVLDI